MMIDFFAVLKYRNEPLFYFELIFLLSVVLTWLHGLSIPISATTKPDLTTFLTGIVRNFAFVNK